MRQHHEIDLRSAARALGLLAPSASLLTDDPGSPPEPGAATMRYYQAVNGSGRLIEREEMLTRGNSTRIRRGREVRAEDPDLFRDPYLKFQVRKPGSWRFLPPAWSPVAQVKNATEDPDALIKLANLPFCCAMGHHDSREHAYPTLQATFRPFLRPSRNLLQSILDAHIGALADHYVDFTLVRATSDAIVGGHPANIIIATFMLPIQPDEGVLLAPVLARSFVVFTQTRAFTIGLSSCSDSRFFDESEISAVIESVRIGA